MLKTRIVKTSRGYVAQVEGALGWAAVWKSDKLKYNLEPDPRLQAINCAVSTESQAEDLLIAYKLVDDYRKEQERKITDDIYKLTEGNP